MPIKRLHHSAYRSQHDDDRQVTPEVDRVALPSARHEGRGTDLDRRGIAGHGYAVEPACNGARATLNRWTAAKAASTR